MGEQVRETIRKECVEVGGSVEHLAARLFRTVWNVAPRKRKERIQRNTKEYKQKEEKEN